MSVAYPGKVWFVASQPPEQGELADKEHLKRIINHLQRQQDAVSWLSFTGVCSMRTVWSFFEGFCHVR